MNPSGLPAAAAAAALTTARTAAREVVRIGRPLRRATDRGRVIATATGAERHREVFALVLVVLFEHLGVVDRHLFHQRRRHTRRLGARRTRATLCIRTRATLTVRTRTTLMRARAWLRRSRRTTTERTDRQP